MIKEMNKFLPPLVELKDQVYLYTPSLYNLSFKAVTSRLDHFLAFEEFIFQPEKVKEIHAMRTSNKWLRYTCETFAPLYSDELKHPLLFLRKTQEALGELHDCDLWIQYLPVFMEKEEKRTLEYFGKTRPYRNLVPGLEYLLEQKQKERLALYQVFVETWQNSQAENIWGELRQAIQAPFSQQVDLSKQPNSTSSVQEP
jgi:CHAD domain-containing protein